MASAINNAKEYNVKALDELDNKELFSIYRDTKDIKIRNELANRYLYIPEILSKKYVNKGIDYEDIYQVASLGLIYAIERFDIDRGFEFSSFATPTIIGEIKKYFRDKGWAIRVPRRIQELSKKVNDVKLKLQQSLQRVPKVKDIADYLKVTEEEVLEAMEAGYVYTPKSLDVSYENSSDDKEVQLKDIIGEDDKNFLSVENRDFLQNCMKKLNEVEIKIVHSRFLNDKTQVEVAADLGVSQMTVSRMEKRIINKFRSELKKLNEL
ncbi:SigB/SigF/SigG family RNA polymerase sigma factor [Paramaledivibacter caminithermalis]|jgi:RNA polymerase sigma-B factor|uniref:RNA polymerase, sigma 37 subunit, RpsB/SigB n=1 Tax=Paramaledivibacter caminithermalis (strain DSM 15212 / CIP 107654 / DViRD3) TaxID=1121301 RepID=A0A1M6NXH5_PARC5|nr:SigB/SigF/SigG family RNA polymerase sigma factor [Paramaledivibacter caminithermalis]SHK00376.1 RNA polymerase, sigma 37 subunit, RpsB/SigB [Paramaledivibacter caminithermalis DSM 15212]